MPRTTHTYAVLEISKTSHDEIRKLLEKAGYDHAFIDDVIDMNGIGLRAVEPTSKTQCQNCSADTACRLHPRTVARHDHAVDCASLSVSYDERECDCNLETVTEVPA